MFNDVPRQVGPEGNTLRVRGTSGRMGRPRQAVRSRERWRESFCPGIEALLDRPVVFVEKAVEVPADSVS
jgi:hypothetical protein